MAKSTKSTSSRPSILKHTRKYAGTPKKKPSCIILRSVLVQTDMTFDNQIRKLPGGPPPPTSIPSSMETSTTLATSSGASGQASTRPNEQPPPEILRLGDGTVLVENRGNFMGRPPPPSTTVNQDESSPTTSSSSSSETTPSASSRNSTDTKRLQRMKNSAHYNISICTNSLIINFIEPLDLLLRQLKKLNHLRAKIFVHVARSLILQVKPRREQ